MVVHPVRDRNICDVLVDSKTNRALRMTEKRCVCENCTRIIKSEIPDTANTTSYLVQQGSGDQFFVYTGTVHGGFAVLLRTSCYEFVTMILYCIIMLDMKYACCIVDMCCVGWGWIWGSDVINTLIWAWLEAKGGYRAGAVKGIEQTCNFYIFVVFLSWICYKFFQIGWILIWLVLFSENGRISGECILRFDL